MPGTSASIDNGNKKRGQWRRELHFIFSCMSVTFGISSVWRFPFQIYTNGGCAFILAYLVTSLLFAVPIVFLEVSMGQYLGSGGMTTVGHLCPILKGAGIASTVLLFVKTIYYPMIGVYSLFYLVASFTTIPDLPWNTCDGWWNTESCIIPINMYNGTQTIVQSHRISTTIQEFWKYRVLQQNDIFIATPNNHLASDNIWKYGSSGSVLGSVQWELVGASLCFWMIIYLITRKGIYSSGKVMWLTTFLPYICMVILLIRVLILPGAFDGLLFLYVPDWTKLYEVRTWTKALTRTIYMYSLGLGIYPALASYNKFHDNFFKGIVISSVLQIPLNLLFATLMFAIFGFIAHVQNTNISNVVTAGTNYAFVVVPELVSHLTGSVFWALIFFTMLFSLVVRAVVYVVEALVIGVTDNWQKYLQKHQTYFRAIVCLFMFLCGLPFCCKQGYQLLLLVDYYNGLGGLPFLWVIFFQTLAWTFEAKKFCKCVQEMTGCRPNIVIILFWMINAMKVMIVVWSMWFVTSFYYQGHYVFYSNWGYLLSVASMIWVPAYFIYYIVTTPGSMMKSLHNGIRPNLKSQLDAYAELQNVSGDHELLQVN